jgi:hypothetical protein
MKSKYDDPRVERDRIESLDDSLDRSVGDQADGDAIIVVKTFAESAYPASAHAFYACKIHEPGGNEVEGGAGTLSDTGVVIYAYNLGSSKPPVGTALLAVQAGDRWVLVFNG